MSDTLIFTPVMCNRGRKWRGSLAYFLGDISDFNVAYNVTCQSAKLWDPAQKKYVYANPEFLVDLQECPSLEDDKREYISKTINDTLTWCKTQKQNESEAKQFARNILKKKHPELLPYIEEHGLTDQRNAYEEIEKTLTWALGLKTRPCIIYGKRCPGGNPLPEKKKMNIVMKTLHKKGIDKLPDFQQSWEFALTLHGLGQYRVFIVPVNNEQYEY